MCIHMHILPPCHKKTTLWIRRSDALFFLVARSSPVCSRVLPVCCRHRPVLYPRGTFPLTRSTSATMLPSKGTRQPNTNERQILSTTTIRLFSIGSRFLIIFSFLWAIIQQLVHRVSSNMICDGATCVSLSTCVTPGISHDPHPEGELWNLPGIWWLSV